MSFRRLHVFSFVGIAALGCGGDDTPVAFQPPNPPVAEEGLCATKKLEPWSRKSLGVGGAVALNEVMYHPAGLAELEWIELYNPMGIDVDVSGFRLDGAVAYTFPSGTRIPSRGFLVVAANADLLAKEVGFPVAVGSYAGQLPNDAGTIELWNNAGRLLDSMRYQDVEPWPVIPDGSGASLAKRAAGASSEIAEEWTSSARIGGTPGADNFPDTQVPKPLLTLVPEGASWKYDASGMAPAADWASPAYDDSTWTSAPATFFATNAPPSPVTAAATFTADNFFALYVGKLDGSGLQLIGRDALGDWTSPETFSFDAAPDDYVYVAAWEAPGDNGGPQSLIGQFVLPSGALLPTAPSMFEGLLGPQGGSPGGLLTDPAPAPALIQSLVAAANQNQTWAAPKAFASNASAPWGPTLSGIFAPETQFMWSDTFNDVSASNTSDTFVLFRSKAPLVPAKGATELGLGPTTRYFRTTFQVPNDISIVQPWLDALIDDGAVFYLNGAEVLRLRMPGGAINASTLASIAVTDATLSPGNLIKASALLPGKNVLAVEVHQAAPNDPDMTFGASLATSVTQNAQAEPAAGLVFNEVEGANAKTFWLELANLGSTALDVGGFVITSSKGGEYILPVSKLEPGELRKIDAAELGFVSVAGDKLFLYTPDRGAVIDGVALVDVPRGRSPAEPHSFLYPNATTPGTPNVFVEPGEIVINEIMYHPPPVTAPDGSQAKGTLEWIELYNRGPKPVDVGGFQLVDAIEYEIPAGVVVPAGGYLVVASDLEDMKAVYPALAAASGDMLVGDFKGSLADSGENLVLRDACGNPVDVVPYRDGGRWPKLADGGGSSLELRDARADNATPEAWSASDESQASTWQTITYEGVATPSSVGPDGLYQEFVLGLLDAGVVLLDDISVVEDPAGAAKSLVGNGTFESGGASSWRILGNHRHSEVIADPADPANHVLQVVATGPMEHMHNHLETTLASGQTIQDGATYRITMRAKWVAGSNQLHSRLYFNRLAKTSELALPSKHGTPLAPNGKAEENLGPTYAELRHAPVVPHPYEPVVVSVVAADPDGVADLTLFYSANGGAFANLPMTNQGDGRFAATIPGGSASSVYQFYVDGKDTRGATASFPALGPASRALFKIDDGKAETKGLHNLRILMTPGDTDWMFEAKNLMSNDFVGATVIDDEKRAYYDVGVRLKSSERGRPEVARVGFALRFSPENPYRGMYRDFMVDRSEGVGFGQRELLFNQAMNHAGTVTSQYDDLAWVLTPRPEHVGPAQLQMARFGDLLLDFQFEDGGDGMLFEYELIYHPLTTESGTPDGYKLPQPDSVVGTPIQDLGDDKEAYRFPFILKNNRWRDDYRAFIQYAKVFGLAGPAFDAKIDSVIDVDEWLRAFAFATLSGAVDNYADGSQHNGNFYVRPSDSRVLYFPHDLDFYGGSPDSPVVASGDLAKLIARPERARAYYGHLYDIISTSYNGTYMAYWANHLGQLLPAQDFTGHLQFITDRADWVLNAAPDAVTKAIPKVAFAVTTNGGAPLSVSTSTLALDGVGWIDVANVWRAQPKALVALTWSSQTTWQATIPLSCGVNTLELDAVDRHEIPVGSDTFSVTRTGGACP